MFWRWIRRRAFPICSILALTLNARADIPINLFELDGDSVTGNTCVTNGTSPNGCDDWNLLNGTTGTNGSPGKSIVRTFASEPAGVNVFQGGGSKDPLNIQSWRWKQGSTPDKDTITNAYAAAYKDDEGHLNIMFGADRYAVNGNSNIGLWFFQQDVHPVGTMSGGFSGTHVNNDVFIVSAFTQGGAMPIITVYIWDSGCTKGMKNPGVGDCADTNLRLKFVSSISSGCEHEGCAVVNDNTITVSWPYLAKFGSTSYSVPTGGFFEGGLDIGLLLGSGTPLPCFTSFLIETRSSQQASAVLKDFVSGGFKVCGLSVTKNCNTTTHPPTINAAGTSIHYHFDGTVTNTGFGTLYRVAVMDTLPGGATNATFSPASGVFTSPLDPGAQAPWSVEFDSTAISVNNSAFAEASVVDANPGGCGDPETVCSASSDIATCSVSPSNSITVTKSCGIPSDPAGYPNAPLPGTQLVNGIGEVAVQVNFSGEVCNSGQSQLMGVHLSDSPDATITLSSSTIGPAVGGTPTCVKYSGGYKPTTFSGDGTTTPGRYYFDDNIKVTGAAAALGDSPAHDPACVGTFNVDAQACGNATCHICPSDGLGGGLCAGK